MSDNIEHNYIRVYRDDDDKVGRLVKMEDNAYFFGKIYKIVSDNDLSKVYVGLTTNELEERLKQHVKDSKSIERGKKGYVRSFDIIKLGNYRIELLEEYPCNSKYELEIIEDEYIELFKDICVNEKRMNKKKKINTYKNGKIYKLVSKHIQGIVVGSTMQSLNKRLSEHRNIYRKWKDGRSFNNSANQILCFDDADIILVEEYSCDTKEQLLEREQYYMDTLPNVINKINAIQDPDYKKKHYAENIEQEKMRCKAYRENPENKERIAERCRKFYETHLEDIKIKRSLTTTCECGLVGTIHHLPRHMLTDTHNDRMEYIKKGLPIPDKKLERKLNNMVVCQCGIAITKLKHNRHKTTYIHDDRMEYINKGQDVPKNLHAIVIQCKCGLAVFSNSIEHHDKSKLHLDRMANLNSSTPKKIRIRIKKVNNTIDKSNE